MNTLHNEGGEQHSGVFLTEQSPSGKISLDLQCKQIPTKQKYKLCRNPKALTQNIHLSDRF